MSDTLDQLAHSSEAAALAKVGIAAGSASSVIFGISAEVVGVVCGIAIALSSLIYQIWATERRIKILKELRNPHSD